MQEGQSTQAKSFITEATATAVISSGSIILMQYAQGGVENISQTAVTAFVTAIVPLALRVIHKKRSK